MTLKSFVVAGLIAVMPLLAGSAAEARISCSGDYQIVNGSAVATPFCEDHHLAQVARQHGAQASAATIRRSLDAKQSACDVTSGDIRTSETCDSAGDGFDH